MRLSDVHRRDGLRHPAAGQDASKKGAGVRGARRRDLLGRAGGDHLAAAVAAFRPHVDDPVGGLDHVEVVLDHQHGVAGVDQALQHLRAALDVGEVQAGGRLVEDVERAAGGRARQLVRQLDALGLAARERRAPAGRGWM